MSTDMHAPNWSDRVVARIGSADDFRIAPFREDGVTPGTTIWVWAVTVNGQIYIRSANPNSRWFAAAIRTGGGLAGPLGDVVPVHFEHVAEDAVRALVDAAYLEKYGTDPYYSSDMIRRSYDLILRVAPIGLTN